MKNNNFDKIKRVYFIFKRENNEKWFRIMKLHLKNKKIRFIIKNKIFLTLKINMLTINVLRARQDVLGNTPEPRICDINECSRCSIVLLGLSKLSNEKCSKCSIVLRGLSKLSNERSSRVYNSRTRHPYGVVFNFI